MWLRTRRCGRLLSVLLIAQLTLLAFRVEAQPALTGGPTPSPKLQQQIQAEIWQHSNAGQASYFKGQYQRAAEEFDRAMRAYASSPSPNVLRAWAAKAHWCA